MVGGQFSSSSALKSDTITGFAANSEDSMETITVTARNVCNMLLFNADSLKIIRFLLIVFSLKCCYKYKSH